MNFEPHDYQAYAIDYIETHPVAAVLLDMGLGKTVISLTAIADLLFDSFAAHRILVVAPLRVARDTWPAELEKWSHLHHLTYTVAVGSAKERRAALMQSADITIINRENLSWLIEESGFPFDYDTVILDELSSFKNHQSKRFKALLHVRPKVKRIVGLTGTPSSNGLMDLWAEFRLLDMGQRLGRFITQYRNAYFTPEKKAKVKALTAAAAERNGFEADMFDLFYEALDKQYEPVDVFGSGVIPSEIIGNFMEKNDDGTYLVLTSIKAKDNDELWKASEILAQGGQEKDKTMASGLIVIDPLFYTTDMLEIRTKGLSR